MGKAALGAKGWREEGEGRLKDTRGGWTNKQDIDTEEGAFKLDLHGALKETPTPRYLLSPAVVTNMGSRAREPKWQEVRARFWP